MAMKWRIGGTSFLMAAHWLSQFILVLIFIFNQGLDTPKGPVGLKSEPSRIVEVLGDGDAGSYLKAALDLIASGENTPQFAWVLNLWPPGMVWLDAAVIRYSPLEYGVTIGLITALVWSAPLALLTWPFVGNAKSRLIVILVELAILGTSPFQSWILDEGLFYSDGLAAGLFLLGLALIVNRVRSAAPMQVWIRDGILAGISFAAAVYFRAAYQLLPWILAANALLIVVIVVRRSMQGIPAIALRCQAALLISAAITVPVLMHPYSSFVHDERGRTQFVMTQELMYENVWRSRELDKVPAWLSDAGSTLGCDIDPDRCGFIRTQRSNGRAFTPEELRDALLSAMFAHPLNYAGNRISYISKGWFVAGPYGSPHPLEWSLYLLSLLTAIGVASILAIRGKLALLIVPLMALAILAPFAITHVEFRYLFPLKLLGLLTPLLILTLIETPPRYRASNSALEIQ